MNVNILCARNADPHVVADLLAVAGMSVEQVLPRLRVVSGTVPASALDVLARVPGVLLIEDDRPTTPALPARATQHSEETK